MKKLLSAMVAVIMCITMAAGGEMVCAADSLVVNGGFEDGLTGWTYESEDALVTSGENASPDGGNYVSLPVEGAEIRTVVTGLTGNTYYQLSVYAKSSVNGAAHIACTPATYDGTTATSNGDTKNYSHPSTNGVWAKLTQTILVPAGSDALQIRLLTPTADDALAWDGLVLEETENIVPNNSFEAVLDDGGLYRAQMWSMATENGLTIVPGGACGTNSALQIVRTSTRYTVTQDIAVEGGKRYTFSFWSKLGVPSSSKTTGVGCNFRDESGSLSTKSLYVAVTTEWQKYTMYLETPANATKIRLTVAAGNSNVTLLYDEFSLVPEHSAVSFYEEAALTDDLTNANIFGKELATLKTGTVKAVAHVAEGQATATMLVCVYDKTAEGAKRLRDVQVISGRKTAETDPYFHITSDAITIDALAENMTVEGYLWNSIAGLQPYAIATVLY